MPILDMDSAIIRRLFRSLIESFAHRALTDRKRRATVSAAYSVDAIGTAFVEDPLPINFYFQDSDLHRPRGFNWDDFFFLAG